MTSTRAGSTRTSTPRRIVGVVLPVVLGTLVAACGVSSGSEFDPLDQADTPFRTTPTPSTATTTTTETAGTPTSPSSGATSVPSQPRRGSTAPPTTSAVAVEPVTLYFATTSLADPKLTSETRTLSRPATLARVVSALAEGPQPRSGTGLQTLIPPGLVVNVDERRGVAYVELDVELMSDALSAQQQRLAIGQLVLTLGMRPGIGQIQFTQGGKPYPISVPSRNGQTYRRPVADDDFASLTETDSPRSSDIAPS